MKEEISGILVHRYCNACGLHVRRYENPPFNPHAICPKCGRQFEYAGMLPENPSVPGTNTSKCPHCAKTVSYDFKAGDNTCTCPECGGAIIVPGLGANWFFPEDNHDEPIYDAPYFMAEHPSIAFERTIAWEVVLGYGKRPDDVIKQIEDENALAGPYSWDLACKIGKIVQLCTRLSEGVPDRPSQAERWFNDRFGHVIRNKKLQGIKPPEHPRPKGFWENLFG